MEVSPSAKDANYYGYYPYMIEENYFSQGNLEVQTGENTGDGNVLIAYFSWGGNTQGVAEEIQSQTGGGLV